VVIASPGFIKDQFLSYTNEQAQKEDIGVLKTNKSKFITAHASSGHKHALREVINDPTVAEKLKETKALGEVLALDHFYEMMKVDPDRAFYGLSDIKMANERLAISTLLLVDDFFSSSDQKTRKQYVALVQSVKENGGQVRIFSTLHVSGEQLKQLGGIAAILRFPLPDIEHVDSDDDEGRKPHGGDGDDDREGH